MNEKYNRWLEEFGCFISRTGRISDCATALGISKQSAGRYFVHKTHECPARVFLAALEWMERQREWYHRNGYSYITTPSAEFQTWNVVQVVPKQEPAIEGSKSGTDAGVGSKAGTTAGPPAPKSRTGTRRASSSSGK